MHSNMLSMSDRSRMKAHIQSLTLLATNKTSSAAVKPLEDALSQTESEKKQLLETIRELEAKIQEMESDPFHSSVKPSFNSLDIERDEIAECLKIQLNQATTECNKLKKELRTASMLKLSETDKLRQVEVMLRYYLILILSNNSRLENEKLDKSQAAVAKLQFELEEERNKMGFHKQTWTGEDANDTHMVTNHTDDVFVARQQPTSPEPHDPPSPSLEDNESDFEDEKENIVEEASEKDTALVKRAMEQTHATHRAGKQNVIHIDRSRVNNVNECNQQ